MTICERFMLVHSDVFGRGSINAILYSMVILA
jgi:hypothetical protein